MDDFRQWQDELHDEPPTSSAVGCAIIMVAASSGLVAGAVATLLVLWLIR